MILKLALNMKQTKRRWSLDYLSVYEENIIPHCNYKTDDFPNMKIIVIKERNQIKNKILILMRIQGLFIKIL